jgi:hypothetical protein
MYLDRKIKREKEIDREKENQIIYLGAKGASQVCRDELICLNLKDC